MQCRPCRFDVIAILLSVARSGFSRSRAGQSDRPPSRRSKWIVIRFASGSTRGEAGRKRNRNKGAKRPVSCGCFTSVRCRLKLSHHLLASSFSHFLIPSRKWCIADYLDFLRVSPVLLVLLSHPSCRLRRVVCQEQETGLPIE